MSQKTNTESNQNYKLVLVVLLVLVIYLLYNNQKENFENSKNLIKSKFYNKFNVSNNNNYGYNNINDNSGSRYSVSGNKLENLKSILNEIVDKINIKTDSNFYLGNIDNITKSLDNENRYNYLIDTFLFEKDKDYTLK